MTHAARVLLATLALVPLLDTAAAREDGDAPEVRSPANGARIGAPGDTHCSDEGYCDSIIARGWVPPGRAAFFVVAPLNADGRMWVQDIPHVNRNGTFTGRVHLGKVGEGAGEAFQIFALACASRDRLAPEQIISSMPADCDVSDAVDVYRER